MHAVDERPVLIKHVLRNCFVGRQHELLDNRLRITVDALHNLNRVQLFVQNNLLLRQIKVYSAATRTLVMQIWRRISMRAIIGKMSSYLSHISLSPAKIARTIL